MDIAANINAQDRVAKRTYSDDIDFRIVVAPIGTFQTLVGTVHSHLNDVHFFVIKTKDFEGIKVDSSTSDFSTMLKQQLTCTVDIPDGTEEKNFCLNVAQLHSRIKSNSSSALEIVRFKGEKEDSIHVYYPNANPQREFRLRTLTKDIVDNRLFDIETDISVQIRLADFKEICRDYAKYGSLHLKIHIQSAKGQHDEPLLHHLLLRGRRERGHTVLPLRVQEDLGRRHSGRVRYHARHGHREIKEKAQTVYKGTFFLETINNFLKSIEKSFVWLSFSKKGAMISSTRSATSRA